MIEFGVVFFKLEGTEIISTFCLCIGVISLVSSYLWWQSDNYTETLESKSYISRYEILGNYEKELNGAIKVKVKDGNVYKYYNASINSETQLGFVTGNEKSYMIVEEIVHKETESSKKFKYRLPQIVRDMKLNGKNIVKELIIKE